MVAKQKQESEHFQAQRLSLLLCCHLVPLPEVLDCHSLFQPLLLLLLAVHAGSDSHTDDHCAIAKEEGPQAKVLVVLQIVQRTAQPNGVETSEQG